MATEVQRNWTAHLVIACEHAGLRPYFQGLQDEMYHALARIDDPRKVVDYLRWLRGASAAWLQVNADVIAEK